MRTRRGFGGALAKWSAAVVGLAIGLLGNSAGPALADPGIAPGFYTGRHLKTAYNAVTRRSQMTWWGVNLFLKPDGRVLWVTSTLGLVDSFDFDEAASKPGNQSGTYRVAGGKLTIAFQDGSTWVAKITSRSGFTIQSGAPGNFLNLRVGQPARVPGALDGTFYNSSFANVGGGGSVSGDHWITFGRGGAIKLRDSTMLSGTPISGYHDKGVDGTYTIKGYTLTVKANGGETARYNLWVPEGSASQPKIITVGEADYLRK